MIDPAELERLEATLLPALERHQLRLLAHGLRSLQAAAGRRSGDLPGRSELLAWAASQPALREDPGFQEAFLEQIEALGERLRAIARGRGADPLALDLQDLIDWSQGEADRRCATALSPPPPGSAPPG